MRSILVTGGTGFIGSHTSLVLLESGYKIYILDSLINSSIESINRISKICEKQAINTSNKINFYKGDLRDINAIKKVFLEARKNKDEIVGVIHFAGLKSTFESISNPLIYWDVNVGGTINLIKVMDENFCRNIVFSSSASIYGFKNKQKIKEGDVINPLTPYGKTKATIEEFLQNIFYGKEKNWKIANLRYFNPVGAHSSGLIGENPIGTPDNIFPIIIRNALGKSKKLTIFGNDWPTRDGTCIRDYIHIMDLAEGHLKALKYLDESKDEFISLNLGTGKGTSVLELIRKFEETNACKINFEFGKRRKGDCAQLIADNSLALTKINWKPTRNLFDICKDGYSWFSLNPNGY